MLTLLPRHSRKAQRAATAVAVMTVIEMAAIVGQVVRGQTSHYNETTPLNAGLYQAMAVSTMVLWLAHLVVAVVGMLAAAPMVLPSAEPAPRASPKCPDSRRSAGRAGAGAGAHHDRR